MTDNWISVKDQYPALGARVLVWFGDEAEPYMDCWIYRGDNKYFIPHRLRTQPPAFFHQCVTHWQLLPEPPAIVTKGEE